MWVLRELEVLLLDVRVLYPYCKSMADLCYILRVLSWTLFRCGLDLISMVFSVFVIRLMASGSDLIWVMYVVCLNLLLTELLLGMFHVIWCSWSYAWLMEVKFWGLLFKTPIT